MVVAALQRAVAPDGHPRFLLKGGTYLELRLGLETRATKDVDVLFRGNFDDSWTSSTPLKVTTTVQGVRPGP